jgi:hypothetical protein
MSILATSILEDVRSTRSQKGYDGLDGLHRVESPALGLETMLDLFLIETRYTTEAELSS